MCRLTEHPDQRAWLAEDYADRTRTAIEEFVRHASPVPAFRRTAVEDTELGRAADRRRRHVHGVKAMSVTPKS